MEVAEGLNCTRGPAGGVSQTMVDEGVGEEPYWSYWGDSDAR